VSEALSDVLRSFGVAPDALLGRGGEARVYALGADRVLRVLHGRLDLGAVHLRQALVAELAAKGAPFQLPEVLDIDEVAGHGVTIERRLPGQTVAQALATLAGPARDRLVVSHLAAAAALGALHLEPRAWFGELLAEPPIRAATWPDYLRRRAVTSLQRAPAEFASVNPEQLAAALPADGGSAFVHLDAFAGNMLCEGTQITAVLDVGATSLVGDSRLDPLACATYLTSREITPTSQPRDGLVAADWLGSAGLARWAEPARRWLAAYWSWAVDDAALHKWCRSVLLNHS